MLIAHMERGYSFDTFAATIRVNPDSLYEWLKHHENFSEAKKIGSALRNYLVETKFMETVDMPSKKCNPAQMIYWTKNTLGWSDKVEVSGDENKAPVIQLKYNVEKKSG